MNAAYYFVKTAFNLNEFLALARVSVAEPLTLLEVRPCKTESPIERIKTSSAISPP